MIGGSILAALALAGAAPAITVEVRASGETLPVGTAAKDAADDPAIWRNPRQPRRSLIVATDKQAGLYVYGLDGRVRDFSRDGRLNNVDLLDLGQGRVLVAASDRNDKAQAQIRLYRLDTKRAKLIPLGVVSSGAGEAYGMCLGQRGRQADAFAVHKDGTIVQVALRFTRNKAQGQIIRRMKLETQSEGCVVDPRRHTLYVGEEDRGIWAFDARPKASPQGKLVAPVDGAQLVADVEGLAIMPQGRRGGWLIASSQGDNAYALFRLPDLRPAGRFRIALGRYGATQETDGIAAAKGSFGKAYPTGLFIAQDGDNAPSAQNFKLVSWASIMAALRKR
jgi:3-phytase